MGATTNIEWTGSTWNIARGCTKVDADCKYCYMFRDSLKGTRYKPDVVVKTKTVFYSPLKWKEGKIIFVSSLTDFFHEGCDSFRDEAWDIIRKCPQHTFQILTKRPERINDNLPTFWDEIKDRIWLGTSVGSEKSLQRLNELCYSKGNNAAVLFASLEPLHEKINKLTAWLGASNEFFRRLDWVIVGGESGNENGLYRYRPCELDWIENIVQQCKERGCKVFVKQLGTHLAKKYGLKNRHGGNLDEFPVGLQVREFPLL